MPELPEVQTVVRTLAPRVVSRRISVIAHLRDDMVQPAGFALRDAITGRSIVDLNRRAKRIVFTLDDGSRFFVHLGMTGQLTAEPPDRPLKAHTHMVLRLDDGLQVRLVDPRRFGAIVWLGQASHENLGPEPLTLRPARLARLLARTGRAIKTALLDQTLIAGIGNIYADEALHLARIHPATPACALDAGAVNRLNRAIKLVLRRAIRAGGSSIRDYVAADGSRGRYQSRHRVYDREGAACPSCRTPIRRIILAARSTHFCPTCQPPAQPPRTQRQAGVGSLSEGASNRRRPSRVATLPER